jgi:uncharacterized protein (DUF433 family)
MVTEFSSRLSKGLQASPLGKGIYTLLEAARLSKVSSRRIRVVRPFFKELEFSADDRLLRWWPLGMKRGVVLDPDRQFGQPIVTQYGVATEVLYLAVKSGDSEEAVAAWFEVDREAIRDAIEFAERLAA